VNDPTFGREFWRSDGTVAGTWIVKDIASGSLGSVGQTDQNYIEFENKFYFYANDIDHGGELWQTNGDVDNAALVKDINVGSGSSNIRNLAVVNGRLFFAATNGTYGKELWLSDGTESGTIMIADINPNGDAITHFYLRIQDYAVMNGIYFFTAHDGVHGTELWQSDGTPAGTVMVMDINLGAGSSNPSYFQVIDDTLYFAADDGTHGRELWAVTHTTFAQDDYVVTKMGQPITIHVLDNDNYLNLDQVIINESSSPSHGNILLNGTTFLYTPDNGFIGLDSFTYGISDGIETPTLATVYINIEGERLYLPFIESK